MSRAAREVGVRDLRRERSQGGAVPVVQPKALNTHAARARSVPSHGCPVPHPLAKRFHTSVERPRRVLAATSAQNQIP